ncbi:MAG: YggS family pyridoxal phosphate-dependent enzyme [Desulfobacteraceae bacterium]
MDSIESRFLQIRRTIADKAAECQRSPEDVRIIAVSKTQSVQAVQKAINAGVEALGENYIQEAVQKIEELREKPVSWHFIGHLQSNKAKYAVRHFDMIHTVDRIKLAREIDKQAGKINKTQDILIQVNIAKEDTKSGTDADNAIALAKEIGQMEHLSLKGLMCMPPFFDDPERARPYFRKLKELKNFINSKDLPGVSLTHLSMGMSGDYKVAIEEGATMVRIGTNIFGSRN